MVVGNMDETCHHLTLLLAPRGARPGRNGHEVEHMESEVQRIGLRRCQKRWEGRVAMDLCRRWDGF